jgi:hypothetical protein
VTSKARPQLALWGGLFFAVSLRCVTLSLPRHSSVGGAPHDAPQCVVVRRALVQIQLAGRYEGCGGCAPPKPVLICLLLLHGRHDNMWLATHDQQSAKPTTNIIARGGLTCTQTYHPGQPIAPCRSVSLLMMSGSLHLGCRSFLAGTLGVLLVKCKKFGCGIGIAGG